MEIVGDLKVFTKIWDFIKSNFLGRQRCLVV
jgi:hypothetical protein